MARLIETYQNVGILYQDGNYYPSVNGNVECTSVNQVRKWIDNVWTRPVVITCEQKFPVPNIPKDFNVQWN